MFKNFKLDVNVCWNIAIFLCLSAAALIIPDLSWASGQPATQPTAIDNSLCNVVNLLQGRAGRGIATLAIIFLGIGLFLGKISWGLAIAVGLGVGAIFGAGTIVNAVGTGGGANCGS